MYTITLYHTPLDRANDNVLLFANAEQLKTYFKNQSDKVVVGTNLNFDAQNIISTSIIVNIPPTTNLLKILNYNYAVVKDNDSNDVLYYFVENSAQISGYQVRLNLQIDSWNTYAYQILEPSKKCQALINRTHLDRFVHDGTASAYPYVYNFAKTSPLFEREEIQNVSKRVVEKLKLMPLYYNEGSQLNNWLNENISHFVYYYFAYSQTQNYKYYTSSGSEQNTPLPEIKYTTEELETQERYNMTGGAVICICVPIYKTQKTIKAISNDGTKYFNWDYSAIYNFLQNNNGYTSVVSVKVSQMMPLPSDVFNTQTYSFDADDNLILNGEGNFGNVDIRAFNEVYFYPTASQNAGVIGIVNYQNLTKHLRMAPRLNIYQMRFSADELSQVAQNLEPKLYNEDYSIYRIYFGGNIYDMPVSKTSNKPYFIYREVLTPDITKALLTFNVNDEGANKPFLNNTIFNEATTKDYTGMVIALDLSMWFSTTNLQEYLATNKNNLQIFRNQLNLEEGQTLNNAIYSILGGAILGGVGKGGAVGAGLGALGGAIGSIRSLDNLQLKQQYEIEQRALTLDNMAQSPAKMSAINSNAIFMLANDVFGIYIELQQPIQFEQDVVREYLKAFGYKYGRVGDIKDFIKTRKYYNYIQAQLIDIDAPISEQVKDLIKSNFARGIRVWHGENFTTINFDVNNLERSIINGNS